MQVTADDAQKAIAIAVEDLNALIAEQPADKAHIDLEVQHVSADAILEALIEVIAPEVFALLAQLDCDRWWYA